MNRPPPLPPRPAHSLFALLLGTAVPAALTAGVVYQEPAAGWAYLFDGDAAAADLDGTWNHSNGSDEWDETPPGEGRPGGVGTYTEDGVNFVRIQDTGDPRDHGQPDPGSNRKQYLGHDLAADLSADYQPLTQGITLSFRARLATTGVLDQTAPDGGGARADWPADGDGYVIHDGGKGTFSIREANLGVISFSFSDPGAGGLIMNNLNGGSASGDVDTGEAGTANALDVGDPTEWHEFWINLVADTSGNGTHRVDIYLDGSLEPSTFHVTAGSGNDFGTLSYVAIGQGSTPNNGAVDIDFIAFAEGLLTPEPIDVADDDGDGLADGWEIDNFGDLSAEPGEDPDGDGLDNAAEFAARLDPNDDDSDDDGLLDGVETGTLVFVDANDTGTDPRRADTDRDGLSDGDEVTIHGTDPTLRDTDGDGAGDGTEIGGGTDPLNPNSVVSNQFLGGLFTVRHVHSAGDQISDLAGAELALSGGIALQGDVTVQSPFIHFHDDVAPPIFAPESRPYPLWFEDGFGNRDDFALQATGSIIIRQTGMATFVVNSDDGFSLRIDGTEIGSAGNRGRADSVVTVPLDAGAHDLDFITWERGGGAGVSVFIYRGSDGNPPGLNDGEFELLQAGDIHNVVTEDSDGDGMDDAKEIFFFGDLSRDGTADEDGDGLADKAELDNRSDPRRTDTDGDGLDDGAEVNTHGTRPDRVDTDGDSLSDGAEVNTHGTDPTKTDTDDDSFDDAVELVLGSDPADAGSNPGANAVVLDTPNADGESWDTAANWSSGAAPEPGKEYFVIGSIASPLNTPAAPGPVFGGDALTLSAADLVLAHDVDTTAAANLALEDGSRVVNPAGIRGLGGGLSVARSGDAGPSATFVVEGGTLVVTGPVSGGGEIVVEGPAGSSLDLRNLAGGAGDFSGAWTVNGAGLRAITPGSLGEVSRISVNGGSFDADYNIVALGGTFETLLGIAGPVTLDQEHFVADFVVTFSDGRNPLALSTLFPDAIPLTGGKMILDSATLNGLGFADANGDVAVFVGNGTFEIVSGDPDSDGDGLLDAWEQEHFGDLGQAADGDSDGDGLDNGGEFEAGTDPNLADTDGDGLSDGDEVNTHGGNPLLADTDGDGLTDDVEAALGTDPTLVDTDGDSLSDADEVNLHGTDPLQVDSDGDNLADGFEIARGFDPNDNTDPGDAGVTPPTHAWLFNEGAGTVANPLFGDVDGSLDNGAAFSVEGPFPGSGSVVFDGVDDEVNMGALVFNGTTQFSIAFWIKSDGVTQDRGWWEALDSGGGDNWGIRYDSAGATAGGSETMKIGIQTEAGGISQLEASNNVQTTDWQHVAFTYDGDAGEFTLYIDGVEDTPTSPLNTTGALANMVYFRLGDGAKAHWMGRVGETAVWGDYVLTPGEVEVLANVPLSSLGGGGDDRDSDGDGLTDAQEAELGTDPNNPGSNFTAGFTTVFVPGGGITSVNLTFPTREGNTYVIEVKDDFADPDWIELETVVAGPGGQTPFMDTPPAGARGRFYRVRLLRP